MPFKTRKHKIAAAQRNYTFAQTKVSLGSLQSDDEASQMELEKVKQKVEKTNGRSIEDLSYIRRDLLKILVMASFIIAVQILGFRYLL